MSALLTGVVVDLANHPEVHHAVILDGQLLPIRFSDEGEAYQHLGRLLAHQKRLAAAVSHETHGEAA